MSYWNGFDESLGDFIRRSHLKKVTASTCDSFIFNGHLKRKIIKNMFCSFMMFLQPWNLLLWCHYLNTSIPRIKSVKKRLLIDGLFFFSVCSVYSLVTVFQVLTEKKKHFWIFQYYQFSSCKKQTNMRFNVPVSTEKKKN